MNRHGNLSTVLKDRVELWRNERATTKNELGQYPIEAKCICTLWAGVITQTGSLLNGRAGDTTLSKTTHKIVLRYTTNIKPDDWFVIEGIRYNIIYILNPYLNHERLEVFCEVVI